MLILKFSILFLVHCTQALKQNFSNYKLVSITPLNLTQLEIIKQCQEDIHFDVWNNLKGFNKSIDVLLSPQKFMYYKNLLEQNEIQFHIKNENIQEAIDQEHPKSRARLNRFLRVTEKYSSYQEILDFMYQLSYNNSRFVSTYSAGKTYELRNLQVLKIKTPNARRSVWIDCGIHAREWITISTCVYMMSKFILEYNQNDPFTVQLLNYYEVHIMPMFNPDGYEYSFKHSRMWRKNRNPNGNGYCYGVDLNRNFGHYWLTSGSSQSPCADIYAGTSPDSELEVKAVQRTLLSKLGQWDSYITLHSYGQYFFTPWGFTTNLPNDYYDLTAKARVAVNAIRSVDESDFEIGSSANLLYSSSGGAEDWTKAKAGIKYSYCLELRPKDGTNFNGFILPESAIPLAGEEIYQGLKAMYWSIKNFP